MPIQVTDWSVLCIVYFLRFFLYTVSNENIIEHFLIVLLTLSNKLTVYIRDVFND